MSFRKVCEEEIDKMLEEYRLAYLNEKDYNSRLIYKGTMEFIQYILKPRLGFDKKEEAK